ncbi:hypothetical protein SY83_08360 [Paenibacillus swuensis]|uniref:KTSC domain-containing protein n=1 Tax=Paenibacillus swuensis TaxID=1178515 RepID=A0A172TGW8_9BACL|nr:KTSC domain-containing protein [Paenibacillus swuensis]ANE46285.1 hypothetical protein SY83_08360 [Paenibacillus swuensis]
MNIIPIGSKQISYIRYDSCTHELVAHYHTGEVRTYASISEQEYDLLVRSCNKYDAFVYITQTHGDLHG